MGHKVTLTDPDGETKTLARYPSHDDAQQHLADYCRWDNAKWEIAEGGRSAADDNGRELTITPAPIYCCYDPGHVETDPRSGWYDWHDADRAELQSLDIVSKGVLGIVLPSSDLNSYLDEHKRDEVDPPEYYSRFPEDGNELVIEGPPMDEGDEGTGLASGAVKGAILMLNGKGRYPSSEHALHDCLPYPCLLEREGHGAVLIAPRIVAE